MNVGQVEPATKQCFDIAFLVGKRLGFIHIRANARIFFEVALDSLACLAAAHADLIRQTKRRHSVDKAEVNRLCAAALITCDFV